MDIAPTPPSLRASRAHALKNCLTVIHAVNQLLESEVSARSRERLVLREALDGGGPVSAVRS